MIKLFTGLPGCGKSYRVVYELREAAKTYYIFHNIDELKEELIEDGKYIQKFPTQDHEFVKFFSLDNQEALQQECLTKYNRPILIIIDECQRYLDKVNKPIKDWMSYHRHLGQDIWLVTQNKFNIAKEYVNLTEIEIQGKRGYVFTAFIYSYFVNGERVKTDRLPKDKSVFALYKSMSVDEVKKPKSKLLLYGLIMGLLAVGFGIYYVVFGLQSGFKKQSEKSKNQSSSIAEAPKQLPTQSQDMPPTIIKYEYVGMMSGQVLLVDSGRNLWLADEIYDGKLLSSRENLKATYVDKREGVKELKLGAVRLYTGGAGVAGRATASAPAQSQPGGGGGMYSISKIVVDVR